MSYSLDGTVGLVTGAGSEIGDSPADALAVEGAPVTLVARRKDRLDDVAGRAAVSHGDRLDFVVNNLGAVLVGATVDAPSEEWERMVALNLTCLHYVGYAAMSHRLRIIEQEG